MNKCSVDRNQKWIELNCGKCEKSTDNFWRTSNAALAFGGFTLPFPSISCVYTSSPPLPTFIPYTMAKSTSKQAPTKKVAASTRTRPTIATRKRTVQSNEDHENVAPMHGGRQVAPTTRVTRSATVALTDRELNDASEPAAVASTRKSKASHRAATSVRRTVNNNGEHYAYQSNHITTYHDTDGSDEESNPCMETPQTQSSRPPTPSTRTHATNSNRQRANVPGAVNANDVEAVGVSHNV